MMRLHYYTRPLSLAATCTHCPPIHTAPPSTYMDGNNGNSHYNEHDDDQNERPNSMESHRLNQGRTGDDGYAGNCDSDTMDDEDGDDAGDDGGDDDDGYDNGGGR